MLKIPFGCEKIILNQNSDFEVNLGTEDIIYNTAKPHHFQWTYDCAK